MIIRRKREKRRLAIVHALEELKREYPHPLDVLYINDMIFYAEKGSFRYKLDESWIENTREYLDLIHKAAVR